MLWYGRIGRSLKRIPMIGIDFASKRFSCECSCPLVCENGTFFRIPQREEQRIYKTCVSAYIGIQTCILVSESKIFEI